MAVNAIRGLLLSVVILLPFHVTFGINPTSGNGSNKVEAAHYDSEVPPSAEPKVVLLDIKEEYCDTECFLKKNKDTVEFFAKTFGIDSSYIYEDLIKKNDNSSYDEYNIGLVKDTKGLKKYGSFEEGLIEYLFGFAKENPQLVTNTVVPYEGNSEYVIDLIKYFTSIYSNVDYLTAVSIGAAESGHYRVKYMLANNNIYGGMTYNQTLIKYKNIEYGVLNFVRLLSKSYFGRGLNTIESIGVVYNPTYNANGIKIANPHWVNLVNSAKAMYANTYSEVAVSELIK